MRREASRSFGHSREELLRMSVEDSDPNFPAARWPIIWWKLYEKGSLTLESHHRIEDGRIFQAKIPA